eukprot:3731940-Rhodomonas_salina.1
MIDARFRCSARASAPLCTTQAGTVLHSAATLGYELPCSPPRLSATESVAMLLRICGTGLGYAAIRRSSSRTENANLSGSCLDLSDKARSTVAALT